MVLDGIPQEADLSTLMVLSRGVSIDLLQWQRVGATNDVHHAGEDASVGLDAGTGTVTWKPSCQPVPGGQGLGLLPVKCRVRSTTRSEGGGLYVIYTTTGLSWSAEYQVSIRGERTDEKEAMSVDLSGVVRILNGTVGNYPNAVVRLLSSGLAPRRRDLEAPGFLMLDEDSPLSDLWRPAPADSGTPFEYDLPARVSVQPGVETDVSLVRTLRTPASRLYWMRAEDFPTGVMSGDRPLRKTIVFGNVAANQLGFALPAGPVRVFAGSTRSQLLQNGWFEHTPANGEFRIDLGPAEEVRGRRAYGSMSPGAGGVYEQAFVLHIANLRDTEVRAQVDEKPPLNLEWSVLSATKPYSEVGRRMHFDFTVGGRSEEVIEYRLRVKQIRP